MYVDLTPTLEGREVVSDRHLAQEEAYQSSSGKEITEVEKPPQNTKDSMMEHYEKKGNSNNNKIIL